MEKEETISDLILRVRETEKYIKPKITSQLREGAHELEDLAREDALLYMLYGIISNYGDDSKESIKLIKLFTKIQSKHGILYEDRIKELTKKLDGKRVMTLEAYETEPRRLKEEYDGEEIASLIRRDRMRGGIGETISTATITHAVNSSKKKEKIFIAQQWGMMNDDNIVPGIIEPEKEESIWSGIRERLHVRNNNNPRIEALIDEDVKLTIYYQQLEKARKSIRNDSHFKSVTSRNREQYEKMCEQIDITIQAVIEEISKVEAKIHTLLLNKDEHGKDVQLKKSSVWDRIRSIFVGKKQKETNSSDKERGKRGQRGSFVERYEVDSEKALEERKIEEEKYLICLSMFSPKTDESPNAGREKHIQQMKVAVNVVYNYVMNKEELTDNDIENMTDNLYWEYVMKGWYAEPETPKGGAFRVPEEYMEVLRPVILKVVEQVQKFKKGEITSESIKAIYRKELNEQREDENEK